MNSLFDTSHTFTNYSAQHFIILGFFLLFSILYVRKLRPLAFEKQRKILLYSVIILSLVQLAKIPLNLYTGRFDVTKDIPLHLCNFLPFFLIWVYAQKSRKVWSVIFFWVILGCSQANFTPANEYSLFYYDSIRYWTVHTLLVLFTLYPAIAWKWEIKHKDVWRTLFWLNITAAVIYCINLLLNSNYIYIMNKPEGTNFYSLLPEWPYYLIALEFIILGLAYLLYGIYKIFNTKKKTIELSPHNI